MLYNKCAPEERPKKGGKKMRKDIESALRCFIKAGDEKAAKTLCMKYGIGEYEYYTFKAKVEEEK